ncbi:glycosyltransferase [Mycobacterium sp. 94-17]|uniref:glycosyltransferase n=1 Tax=Mycobacterium sp. 94-17 TaxID=2986147 RepID=UPI002D1F19CB|nr:glycosyltransferase [Mycobacterium sp. 94-17]MEB4212027.1 glycosyltransferase [Mycobacterium sp. 94-17]
MKFVLVGWGSRGDVEPGVVVGRELLRRGHDVRIVVAPDLVGFAESVGLSAVACGPDVQSVLHGYRDFWTCLFRSPWRIRKLVDSWRDSFGPMFRCRDEISTVLTSLAEGADLLFTGINFEEVAVNVAEYHDIPLTTLHWFPLRPNGQLFPIVPAPLLRTTMTVYGWLGWRTVLTRFEAGFRRELGLPKARVDGPRRMAERGWLEIQAYDEVCFRGLAAEWAKSGGRRPFIGSVTMEAPSDTDDEIASWIAGGTPPIFFGFGSMPVEYAADTLTMISAACAQLGERALVCAAGSDFSRVPHFDHVKVVNSMNYAAIFPACRAVVHHGGAGTTAVGLRAGVPTLILSTDLFQTLWGIQVKRLKIGTARRFSTTTRKSLVADLRTILAPQYVTRAREVATQMSKPAEAITTAADLVEDRARGGRIG